MVAVTPCAYCGLPMRPRLWRHATCNNTCARKLTWKKKRAKVPVPVIRLDLEGRVVE